jgi:hypothetical protein
LALRQAIRLEIIPSTSDNIMPNIPIENNAAAAQKGAKYIISAIGLLVIRQHIHNPQAPKTASITNPQKSRML